MNRFECLDQKIELPLQLRVNLRPDLVAYLSVILPWDLVILNQPFDELLDAG